MPSPSRRSALTNATRAAVIPGPRERNPESIRCEEHGYPDTEKNSLPATGGPFMTNQETSMAPSKSHILLATIGAAQGLKGEVRLNTMTAEPMGVLGYGALAAKDGRDFVIERGRLQKDVVIVKFKGVDDRTAAEALRGIELFVERTVLDQAIRQEDEFLYADLIGLHVTDETGQSWGLVVGVYDFGGGDVVEVKGPDGRLRMIPFSKAAVPVVDIAGGKLEIDRVASGIEDAKEGEDQ
jgi:16S rRNA processing protein RimM